MNAMLIPATGLWTDVGAITDIPRRGARRVPTPGGDIAVFRSGDNEVFALRDRCPHKGGPLSQGIVHGRSVTCPLHGLAIDLASGEALGADRGQGCAPVIPLRIEEGRILIRTDG
ncbi:nitrite reductase small subunit NirD [Phenylobacterium sp.]|uniref:nitrite reductase small subunit NirD n=1 Tax=Phenylobacterium sp. TaxID=1871053 RepID=UPI002734B471|nr:nitrite reductase small subunit NirD [Phenylobacterium sp.]MDP3659609.1 nitrite reductase small subunit NirD [Phenylobacterium sp.]